MRLKPLLPLIFIALPWAAHADDSQSKPGDWTGTGELGLALTRGNTKSENLNAKLNFNKEDATWKDNFYLTALRNNGEVTVTRVVDGRRFPATKTRPPPTASRVALRSATSSVRAIMSSAPRVTRKTTSPRTSGRRPFQSVTAISRSRIRRPS